MDCPCHDDAAWHRAGPHVGRLEWGGSDGSDLGVAAATMTANHRERGQGERIVAVGLLTQRDLDVLGTGFRRSFPVQQDTPFEDLLRALDTFEIIKGPGKPQ
ncbi:hypothetical protein RN629_04165 [Sphingomonadaceae bacterium jetA1]|jgi:hypothetical protein|uniref:hypothetical protein n=1 Tax=Facivitalis istanbulensis TaxID=3075838 RepID=UPI00349B3F25